MSKNITYKVNLVAAVPVDEGQADEGPPTAD